MEPLGITDVLRIWSVWNSTLKTEKAVVSADGSLHSSFRTNSASLTDHWLVRASLNAWHFKNIRCRAPYVQSVFEVFFYSTL